MKIPDGKTIYPISAAQQVLLWSEVFSLEPRAVKEINIISFFMRVPRDCSEEALEKAFNRLLKANDSLRLRMFWTRKGIRQYVADYEYRKLERIQVQGEPGFKEFLAGIYKFKVPMLGANDMVWARLIRLAPADWALVLRIHHAVIDGYSIRLALEQLEKYYDCYRENREPETDQSYSITKYFEVQRKYQLSDQHKADRAFFFKSYNSQPHYSFPAGHRSEWGKSSSESLRVDGETYQRLLAIAREWRCSTQSLLMTLAAVTTHVVTGRTNFAIFSNTHGRMLPPLRQTIGCIMNTLPVFYNLKLDIPFKDLASECYMSFLDTLSHGRLPLSEQVPMSYPEAIKHFFNFNHSWLLFSVMEYEGYISKSHYIMGMIPGNNLPSQFYLSMLEVPGECIDFRLGYQVHKFKSETVRGLLDTYEKIIRAAIGNPGLTIRQMKDAVGGSSGIR